MVFMCVPGDLRQVVFFSCYICPSSVVHLYMFIVQGFPLWWINWVVHLWLLLILLLCTVGYERFHADFLLLWVHGLHLLRFLPHARDSRFPCFSVFCPSHISLNQVWVVKAPLPAAEERPLHYWLAILFDQRSCRTIGVLIQTAVSNDNGTDFPRFCIIVWNSCCTSKS